jgi:hypothetical protein
LGPAVAAIARALDPTKASLPHQQYIYDVAFEIDPDTGLLAYDDVTVVGPRQVTGKTELLMPVMAHRCTGFGPELADYALREFGIVVPEPGPQKVLYTAQRAEDARQKWRDVHIARIKKSPLRALWAGPPRLRLAAEAMFWENGSIWCPGSTTGKSAGTGDTLDLGVIDEMWAQEDGRTEIGMRPTMLTRDWRQLWRASMVPGLSRVPPEKWGYMRQKMIAGRARADAGVRHKNAYFEWSLPETSDPGDEDGWWTCMPGLGYTVPVANVRSDYHALDLVDYCAEYLGWWPTGALPLWSAVSEQTWRDLIHSGEYQEPIALGVDATPELTSASIGMAAQITDGGDIHLELIDKRAGVNWIVEAILSLCRSHNVCAIGIDRNGPLAGMIRPLTRAAEEQGLDITIVGTRDKKIGNGTGMNSAEVAAACAQVYSETGEHDDDDPEPEEQTLRRVRHIGQQDLDTAVGGAVKHYQGDRWRWERVGSSIDVSPLFCVTLARAAGEAEEWIGGNYDIRESLGGLPDDGSRSAG